MKKTLIEDAANKAGLLVSYEKISERQRQNNIVYIGKLTKFAELLQSNSGNVSLANKPDDQYRKLMAAFHANMVHAYPNKTHEEISKAIDQAITKG